MALSAYARFDASESVQLSTAALGECSTPRQCCVGEYPDPMQKMKPARAPLAAVTMVYNEKVFLPLWLRYYGASCGPENLYVLDHGSNDGSTEAHASEGWNRIRLPRTEFDDLARGALIGNFVNGLLEFYETVIFSDADELIVPDPAQYEGLARYCAQLTRPCAFPVALDLVQIDGVEAPLDLSRGILRQRRYGRFASTYCEPLLVRAPIRWGAGFHRSNYKPELDANLTLFHLKRMDRMLSEQRQQIIEREVIWSERAVANNHGVHQRLGSERLAAAFAADKGIFARGLVAPWDFSAIVASVAASDYKPGAGGLYSAVKLKIAPQLFQIPDRFRDAF